MLRNGFNSKTRPYLRYHAYYETLLLNVVCLDGLVILEDFPCELSRKRQRNPLKKAGRRKKEINRAIPADI